MIEHLFVYGTLAPNRPNSHILRNIDATGVWKQAKVIGELESKGWGAEVGFPGLKLSTETGMEIEGLLFSSAKLQDHWAELDQFEGSEYSRELVDAILEDGSIQQAFVYALACNK